MTREKLREWVVMEDVGISFPNPERLMSKLYREIRVTIRHKFTAEIAQGTTAIYEGDSLDKIYVVFDYPVRFPDGHWSIAEMFRLDKLNRINWGAGRTDIDMDDWYLDSSVQALIGHLPEPIR